VSPDRTLCVGVGLSRVPIIFVRGAVVGHQEDVKESEREHEEKRRDAKEGNRERCASTGCTQDISKRQRVIIISSSSRSRSSSYSSVLGPREVETADGDGKNGVAAREEDEGEEGAVIPQRDRGPDPRAVMIEPVVTIIIYGAVMSPWRLVKIGGPVETNDDRAPVVDGHLVSRSRCDG